MKTNKKYIKRTIITYNYNDPNDVAKAFDESIKSGRIVFQGPITQTYADASRNIKRAKIITEKEYKSDDL